MPPVYPLYSPCKPRVSWWRGARRPRTGLRRAQGRGWALTERGELRHLGRTMDRREFVTSFAAIGASAALPTVASAQTNSQTGKGADVGGPAEALRLATLRGETTRQLTTFNLDRKSK